MTTKSDDDRQFFNLLDFLKRTRFFDFGNYKRTSLERRLNDRMHEIGITSYADYQDFLEVHPEEFSPLFDATLINVTTFFRDPVAWNYLKEKVIPNLLVTKSIS